MNRCWVLVVAYSIPVLSTAQSPDLSFWDTNGAVRCFATKGDTLFVGGDFTHVGPFTGGLLPVDATSGSSVSSFGIIDGDVNVVISDGSGGWYVGGSARIDTMNWCNLPVAFVRHIRPDRSVDPTVQVNGVMYTNVTDLALWQGRLIIAGDIDTLNAGPFQNLAWMDTTTLALGAFPNNPNGRVEDMEVVSDVLYMAGDFNTLGGLARTSLGALDLNDGSVHGWQPTVDGLAHCLAAAGDTMYIGGEFITDGGMDLEFLLTADLIVGDTAIHPLQPSGTVNVLVAVGDTLFVGGDFGGLSGQPRAGFGAWNLITSSLLPLDLDIGSVFGIRVNAIVPTPDRIYLGGIFDRVLMEPRKNVAAIDRSTGDLLPWAPLVGGYVHALGSSGADVLIGGRFHIANGADRSGLCAFRISTGELLSWSPALGEEGPDNYQRVGDMDIAGNTLYIGGGFQSAEGQPRLNAAAYDIPTGALTAWDPEVEGAYVKAIEAHNGIVYLGGTFWDVGGQPRNRIAAVNASDGDVTAWNPITSTGFYVNDITMWADTVIVGGLFGDMGGAPRRGLAALDPDTGLALDQSYTYPDDPINTESLLVRGNDVLAGGSFDTLFGSGTSFGLLGYHLDMDQVHIPWNPLVEGIVNAMDELGNALYLGGHITSINGNPVSHYPAVAVDTTSGVYTPQWLPDFGDLCAQVRALKATPTKIFLGAEANNLAGAQRRFFMAVSPATDVSVQEGTTQEDALLILPNPARDRFTVILPSEPSVPWSVKIIDGTGRIVMKVDHVRGPRAMFDRGGLAPGVYVLRVDHADGSGRAARFVLE